MSFIHCQHSSAEDPPCRCPVWEDPEDEEMSVKMCDTCGHRAEWHLPPVEAATSGMERCKASVLPTQQCSCPTWVASEGSGKSSGCSLCGHKKGWHRSTIVKNDSSQEQSCKIKVGNEQDVLPVFTKSLHSRAQSLGTASSTPRLRSQSNRSLGLGADIAPVNRELFRLAEENFAQQLTTPPAHQTSAGSFQNWSQSSRESPLPSGIDSPVQLAAEHMRFILEGMEVSEETSEGSQFSESPLATPFGKTFCERGLSIINTGSSLSLSSTPSVSMGILASSANMYSRDPKSPMAHSFYKDPKLSMSRNSTSSNKHETRGNLSKQTSYTSLRHDVDQVDILTQPTKNTYISPLHAQAMSRCSSRASNRDNSLNTRSTSSLSHNFITFEANLGPSSITLMEPEPSSEVCQTHFGTMPLLAETTSVTLIDELPDGQPRHPSEDRSGKFAAHLSSLPSLEPNDQTDSSAPKPFQTNKQEVIEEPLNSQLTVDKVPALARNVTPSGLKVSSLEDAAEFFELPRKQLFETFQNKSQTFTFSISPPPSSHVFSPGEVVNLVIRLKNPSTNRDAISPAEFEHQLMKWRRINFQLGAFVTKSGTLDDFTQHDILNISQSIHLAEQPSRIGNRTEWQVRLKIPTRVKCDCGPGNLPLPSSCSNAVGHVSYFFSLKGKRKNNLLSTTSESIHVDFRLRSDLTQRSQQLTTSPSTSRSQTRWNALTGGVKAAIMGTTLTHHVEYLSPSCVRIRYMLHLLLSPDSEISESVFKELSASAIIGVSSLEDYQNGLEGQAEVKFDSRDVRLDAHSVEGNEAESMSWMISGYLQVENLVPSARSAGLSNHMSPTSSNSSSGSRWLLRASIQSVLLSQPINIYASMADLQSTCAVRLIVQGMPLVQR